MSNPIGTLGNVDSLNIGGRVYTNLNNLIIISGQSGGANNYTTLREGNATAGYQVTAGKTLTISTVVFYNSIASPYNSTFGYGGTDVGYNGSAPSSPIFYGGGSVSSPTWLPFDSTLAQFTQYAQISFAVPAGNYVFALSVGNHTSFWTMYGYEA